MKTTIAIFEAFWAEVFGPSTMWTIEGDIPEQVPLETELDLSDLTIRWSGDDWPEPTRFVTAEIINSRFEFGMSFRLEDIAVPLELIFERWTNRGTRTLFLAKFVVDDADLDRVLDAVKALGGDLFR